MFCRLTRKFRLRGWEKLPYALLDMQSHTTSFFSKPVMDVLVHCDGNWDFSSFLTSATEREIVSDLLTRGVVEECEPRAGIAPEQRYRFYQNRYVQAVHWSLTGRCNYHCRHCFMSAPEARFGELSHEAALSIARQIGKCGIPRVSLTGGEPLVRHDFIDIVHELANRDVAITQLYTNGSLLTERVIDELAELGQKPVVIMSFDGVGHHDWLRGTSGAEHAAGRALSLCASKGIRTQVQMCLHRGNVDAIEATVNHLAKLGCGGVRIGCVSDMGDWLRNGKGLSLTQDEYREAALRYIPTYYDDGMPLPLILSGVFSASPQKPDAFALAPCQLEEDDGSGLLFSCARLTPQIYADGRIAICDDLDADFVGMPPMASDDPGAEVTTLAEALSTGSRYMGLMDIRRRDFFAQNPDCASCDYLRLCGGGCRANANTATGSVLGRDPITCSFFKDGWAQKVVELVRGVRPTATLVRPESTRPHAQRGHRD